MVQQHSTVQIMENFPFFALCCAATRPVWEGGKSWSARLLLRAFFKGCQKNLLLLIAGSGGGRGGGGSGGRTDPAAQHPLRRDDRAVQAGLGPCHRAHLQNRSVRQPVPLLPLVHTEHEMHDVSSA